MIEDDRSGGADVGIGTSTEVVAEVDHGEATALDHPPIASNHATLMAETATNQEVEEAEAVITSGMLAEDVDGVRPSRALHPRGLLVAIGADPWTAATRIDALVAAGPGGEVPEIADTGVGVVPGPQARVEACLLAKSVDTRPLEAGLPRVGVVAAEALVPVAAVAAAHVVAVASVAAAAIVVAEAEAAATVANAATVVAAVLVAVSAGVAARGVTRRRGTAAAGRQPLNAASGTAASHLNVEHAEVVAASPKEAVTHKEALFEDETRHRSPHAHQIWARLLIFRLMQPNPKPRPTPMTHPPRRSNNPRRARSLRSVNPEENMRGWKRCEKPRPLAITNHRRASRCPQCNSTPTS